MQGLGLLLRIAGAGAASFDPLQSRASLIVAVQNWAIALCCCKFSSKQQEVRGLDLADMCAPTSSCGDSFGI